MLKQFLEDNPGVTPQSRNFSDAFMSLMDKNKGFRNFVLRGAHLEDSLGKSDEEYEKGKKDLLNASSSTGQSVLGFLAYAANGGKFDFSNPGDIPVNEVKTFLSNKLGTEKILAITPLIGTGKKA